jgi:hypothetical protein
LAHDLDRDGDGPMGVPPGGTQGGTTGESPDFNGDGVPDGDSGSGSTDSGSTSDSSTTTQQS